VRGAKTAFIPVGINTTPGIPNSGDSILISNNRFSLIGLYIPLIQIY